MPCTQTHTLQHTVPHIDLVPALSALRGSNSMPATCSARTAEKRWKGGHHNLIWSILCEHFQFYAYALPLPSLAGWLLPDDARSPIQRERVRTIVFKRLSSRTSLARAHLNRRSSSAVRVQPPHIDLRCQCARRYNANTHALTRPPSTHPETQQRLRSSFARLLIRVRVSPRHNTHTHVQ